MSLRASSTMLKHLGIAVETSHGTMARETLSISTGFISPANLRPVVSDIIFTLAYVFSRSGNCMSQRVALSVATLASTIGEVCTQGHLDCMSALLNPEFRRRPIHRNCMPIAAVHHPISMVVLSLRRGASLSSVHGLPFRRFIFLSSNLAGRELARVTVQFSTGAWSGALPLPGTHPWSLIAMCP
ncbi:hypothetical protein OBBRIDRAFT_390170 [Obba rivulosa]|uniref:Uncharacterized protein n=1 Tax=Obba rivulosa TaxID=1052685 RepID=A0A8E2AHI6_9APHY|nr:hypothetical protein OBBRIDRAFT_390170 [Obba rivulosa]